MFNVLSFFCKQKISDKMTNSKYKRMLKLGLIFILKDISCRQKKFFYILIYKNIKDLINYKHLKFILEWSEMKIERDSCMMKIKLSVSHFFEHKLQLFIT